MEVGMMVVEPSEVVVPTIPLMDHVFLPTFNLTMEFFHKLWRNYQGFEQENYKIWKNSNISHTKTCEKHMHG
jgi:hypothetical protein